VAKIRKQIDLGVEKRCLEEGILLLESGISSTSSFLSIK
jgi:hypothetical protein